jgi:hypothetical protein
MSAPQCKRAARRRNRTNVPTEIRTSTPNNIRTDQQLNEMRTQRMNERTTVQQDAQPRIEMSTNVRQMNNGPATNHPRNYPPLQKGNKIWDFLNFLDKRKTHRRSPEALKIRAEKRIRKVPIWVPQTKVIVMHYLLYSS